MPNFFIQNVVMLIVSGILLVSLTIYYMIKLKKVEKIEELNFKYMWMLGIAYIIVGVGMHFWDFSCISDSIPIYGEISNIEIAKDVKQSLYFSIIWGLMFILLFLIWKALRYFQQVIFNKRYK